MAEAVNMDDDASDASLNTSPDVALVCCRCGRGALTLAGDGFLCGACGVHYPLVGGIPCLVPDPPLYRIGWHARITEYVNAVEGRLREIAAEREQDDLPRRTRERLLRVSAGLDNQRRAVESLLGPLVTDAGQFPSSPFPATADPGAPLAVLQHYENIFRDWAWGAAETKGQRELVQRMLTAAASGAEVGPAETLAVYGSGAGRLAADLHDALATRQTFGLDLNPLPLIVGDQLSRGVTLDLPEFPVAPRTADQVVVSHRLAATALRPGLTYLFADAMQPPFAAQSIDVVVSSWFIDAVGTDFGTTAAAINRVLKPGGLWLNLGPLRFTGSMGGQLSIEEVLESLPDAGFALLATGSEDVPYFRSPYTGSSRVETVYWYSARKTGAPMPAAAGGPARGGDGAPPWLSDPTQPVPMMPQLAQIHRSSVFTIGVLSMIDGTRSLQDIAAKLAQSWNAEPAAVQNHLRAFFGSLFG
ncbi:MAG: methyltransferase domain-containing protein [Myxococcales bacterium]